MVQQKPLEYRGRTDRGSREPVTADQPSRAPQLKVSPRVGKQSSSSFIENEGDVIQSQLSSNQSRFFFCQVISNRQLYVLTKQWNPRCIILKNLGEKNFRKKFFLAEYMQGSCVLSNIIWNINFKNIVKKKDFREEQKSLQTYSNNNSWKFAEKVLSGLECSATESSVRTSLFFFCNFSCINEVPTLHNR